MLLTVPASLMLDPVGVSGDPNQLITFGFDNTPGLAGLGQDDTSVLDNLPVVTADPIVAGILLSAGNSVPDTTPFLISGPSNIGVDDNLSSYITNSTAAPTTANGTAQILTAAGIAAAAAAKGITAASGPYAVPGTSLVYNPATGQIINAAGGIVGTAGGVSFSIGSYIPLIVGGLALFMLIQSMGGRR